MGGSSSDKTYTPDFFMVNLRISKTFFSERVEIYGGIQNLLSNMHFVKSTEGQNQEDYYGLAYGRIFTIGAGFKW
jgi:outer membrane receptor for ferrienterochelin and colicins